MYHTEQFEVVRGRELLRVNSIHQSIVFESTQRGLTLFLNDEMQFAQAFEKGYHYALAGSAMLRVPYAKRVLILGGGDGLAARTIYEHNPATHVYLAELDGMMVNTCKTFSPMVKLNKGALEKTRNRIGDATKTILNVPDASMDIVISDFPDYSMDTISLYEPHMYHEIYRALKPGGLISIYPGGYEEGVAGMLKQQFRSISWNQAHIGDGVSCHIIQGVKLCLR